jgi:hypothetical protein
MNLNWKALLVVASLSVGTGLVACDSASTPPTTGGSAAPAAPDAKGDTKAPDAGASAAPDAKAPDAKGDMKAPDAKGDMKAPDAKASEAPKSLESKPAESKKP